jgi:chromosome segregation ATPase
MNVFTTVVLQEQVCPSCGVHYGIDAAVYARRQQTGENFFCTNGHSLVVTESELDRLRKQLASAQGNLSYYRERNEDRRKENERLTHQLRAQKAAKTRLMRRVTNGVCALCNRSFSNVQRHMTTCHPDQVVTATQTTTKED